MTLVEVNLPRLATRLPLPSAEASCPWGLHKQDVTKRETDTTGDFCDV